MAAMLLGIVGYFLAGIIIGLIAGRCTEGRLTEANENDWLGIFWTCVFIWPILLILGAGFLFKELVERFAKKAGGLKIGPQDSFRADSGENKEV